MECIMACTRDCLVPLLTESLKAFFGEQGCIGIIPDCMKACCGK